MDSRRVPRNGAVAFVLSGGGNYGALQVGALQVLLEAGIQPDLLVGTSVGALNAVFLATDPTLDTARRLGEVWCGLRYRDMGTRRGLAALARVLTEKRSVYDSRPLVRLLEEAFPSGVDTFGDLTVPGYAVAACLSDGALRVFGDDLADRVMDGLMASAAMVPFYPPWECNDRSYVDGGLLSSLPLMAAAARGARQVYALHVEDSLGNVEAGAPMLEVGVQALSLMLAQQREREKERVKQLGIPIRTISLDYGDVKLWDYSCGAQLIQRGRAAAWAALTGGTGGHGLPASADA
jgi:NTE family protein